MVGMTWRVILLLLLGIGLGVLAAQEPSATVEQGKLRGFKLHTFKGSTIYAFSGIPYAKPPVGDLRFKEAQSPDPWEGMRSAKQEGSPCIQKDILFSKNPQLIGSEDCLYLNVYTTQLPKPGKNLTALPVMVFIHGGGWMVGHGGKELYGPDYLLDYDVILVTLNYRLGILGFLSTEDEASPGNYGLKDQLVALQWIQRNIAAFGGDPGCVTVFGNSAGGASVHYLLLSPLSKRLFQRGISMSGTALAPWASARHPAKHARHAAALLGCPETPSSEMLSCLRTKDAKLFVNIADNFLEWDVDPLIVFSPSVEPPHSGIRLVPAPVLSMVRETERLLADNIIPWMTGFTSQDGSMRSSVISSNPQLLEEINNDFEKIAPVSLRFKESSPNIKDTAQKIRHFYFGDKKIDKSTLVNLTNMYTDRHFLYPLMQSVMSMRTHSAERFIYLYHMSYRGRHSLTSTLDVTSTTDYGVCHMDDLQYIFNMPAYFPAVPKNETDPDHMMMILLTNFYINFARTGLPTTLTDEMKFSQLTTGDEVFEWTVATEDKPVFADLNPTSPQMLKHLHKRRVNFWESLDLDENGRTYTPPAILHTEL